MTMLAVLRSRSQALGLVSELKAAGVPVQTVSTPKEAGVGCGISAKFDERFFARVKSVVAQGRYSSFSGYMRERGNVFLYL